MKKKLLCGITLIFVLMISLSGCGKAEHALESTHIDEIVHTEESMHTEESVNAKESMHTEESSGVITPEEAKERMEDGSAYFLLDVREQEEYEDSHIAGAVCIPYTELEARQKELPEDMSTMILVYCRSGRRSAIAAETLTEMGYQYVLDFGGIIDWPYDVVRNGESETETKDGEASAAGEKASVEEDAHEHKWEEYDCNYEKCSLCGEERYYQR